jgi:hypothetical protein
MNIHLCALAGLLTVERGRVSRQAPIALKDTVKINFQIPIPNCLPHGLVTILHDLFLASAGRDYQCYTTTVIYLKMPTVVYKFLQINLQSAYYIQYFIHIQIHIENLQKYKLKKKMKHTFCVSLVFLSEVKWQDHASSSAAIFQQHKFHILHSVLFIIHLFTICLNPFHTTMRYDHTYRLHATGSLLLFMH